MRTYKNMQTTATQSNAAPHGLLLVEDLPAKHCVSIFLCDSWGQESHSSRKVGIYTRQLYSPQKAGGVTTSCAGRTVTLARWDDRAIVLLSLVLDLDDLQSIFNVFYLRDSTWESG